MGAPLILTLLTVTGCTQAGDPPASGPDASSAGDPAEVVHILDGDSLVVTGGGEEREVRLIGINAPERGECLADEARSSLRELAGSRVALEADIDDEDRYGRLLRYAFAGGMLINAELARLGLVLAGTFPPNTSRQDEIDSAQAEAEAGSRGQWSGSACGPSDVAEVLVTEVEADPPGSDVGNETVVIANHGTTAVDMSEWVLADGSTVHRYTFPEGTELAPGAVITVSTGCGEDSPRQLHWCADGAVWDNTGDVAVLRDAAGNIVHRVEV